MSFSKGRGSKCKVTVNSRRGGPMMRPLFALSLVLLGFGSSCSGRPLILERYPSESTVGEPGWTLSGGGRDVYFVHRDKQGDHAAWLLEPERDTYGEYGTWMRNIDATAYPSKRL